MKEKFKTKKGYFVFLLITLVFFGIFAKMDFATDTYAVLEESRKNILQNFLQSGRLITAFFFSIFVLLKIPVSITYMLTFLLAIFSISFSMYKLFYIIKENIVDNEIISGILAVSIIINPFSIELFMFIEKGIMTFGILACVLALEQFIKFVENYQRKENNKIAKNKSNDEYSSKEIDKKIKKEFLISVCYMILAVFSYQGVVAIFLALATIFAIKKSKKFTEFLKNTIASVIIYLIPAILNFAMVRLIFKGNRVNGEIILSESLKKIVAGTNSMFNTYNILPRNIFAILYFATILIAIIAIFTNNNIKRKTLNILELVYLDLMTILSTIAPQILQSTASIWFVSRSTYAFASIIGINSLFALIVASGWKEENKKLEDKTNLKTEIKQIKSKSVKNIEIVIEIINLLLIIVTLYKFNSIEIDHYNLNYQDKLIAKEIGKRIYDYEQETGIEIQKIAIYKDKNPRYTYNDIFVTGDINISSFATDWSDVNSINYYNNLKLIRVDQEEEIKNNFEKSDWDYFDNEQIIFKGDTLHLCVF